MDEVDEINGKKFNITLFFKENPQPDAWLRGPTIISFTDEVMQRFNVYTKGFFNK